MGNVSGSGCPRLQVAEDLMFRGILDLFENVMKALGCLSENAHVKNHTNFYTVSGPL